MWRIGWDAFRRGAQVGLSQPRWWLAGLLLVIAQELEAQVQFLVRGAWEIFPMVAILVSIVAASVAEGWVTTQSAANVRPNVEQAQPRQWLLNLISLRIVRLMALLLLILPFALIGGAEDRPGGFLGAVSFSIGIIALTAINMFISLAIRASIFQGESAFAALAVAWQQFIVPHTNPVILLAAILAAMQLLLSQVSSLLIWTLGEMLGQPFTLFLAALLQVVAVVAWTILYLELYLGQTAPARESQS